MTEHLALPNLVLFAARYHIARQLRSDIGISDRERLALEQLKLSTEELCFNGAGLKDSFDLLSGAIAQLRARFDGMISPDLSERLSKLSGRLNQYSCSKCKEAKNEIGQYDPARACQADRPTYKNVKDGGRCIQPVKTLLANLVKWVESLWQALPPGSYPILFATTSQSFEASPAIMRDFGLSGFARSLGDAGSYSTKVGLVVRDDVFDWDQFNLLPYILLHEILCHAFQSLDNPQLRENAAPEDPWSEGWMDSLAHALALEWLETWKAPFLGLSEISFAQAQTTRLHLARYRSSGAVQPLGPGFGRAVFDETMRIYPAAYKNVKMSRHPVTRFSLRLNAITIDARTRIAILENLRAATHHAPAAVRARIGDVVAARTDEEAVHRLRAPLP